MSDFLTNLVARSLGDAPALRPRLAALFEPPIAGAPLIPLDRALDEIGDSGEDGGPVGDRPVVRRTATPQPPDQPGPRPGATASPDAIDERAPRAPQSRPAPDRRQLAAGTISRADAVGGFVDPTAPKQASLHPPPQSGAIMEASTALETPDPPRPSIPRPPARRPDPISEVRSTSQDVVGAFADSVRDQPRVQDQPPLREAATRIPAGAIETRPAADRPMRGPRPPAVRELRPVTRSDPPPPTISVTIGRIEVRAVHQPAPARPAVVEPRPPALSLDDYLKQREGERP